MTQTISTISKNQFIEIMIDNDFSYDGSEALYDSLCELEDDGIETELDPIALKEEFHEIEEEEITLDDVLCYFTTHYDERKAIVYAG